MVAKDDFGPRVHGSERIPDGSSFVAAAAALKDTDDGTLAIEPSIVDGALERDDELFAREDGDVGLDEHPSGRKVDDLATDEAEVAQPDDFAKGPCGASLSGVRALGMKHGAHCRIVWTRRSAGQEKLPERRWAQRLPTSDSLSRLIRFRRAARQTGNRPRARSGYRCPQRRASRVAVLRACRPFGS